MFMSNVRAVFLFALAWGAAFDTAAAQTAAVKAGDPLPAEPRIGVAAIEKWPGVRRDARGSLVGPAPSSR
jgi:hypothetical protein